MSCFFCQYIDTYRFLLLQQAQARHWVHWGATPRGPALHQAVPYPVLLVLILQVLSPVHPTIEKININTGIS